MTTLFSKDPVVGFYLDTTNHDGTKKMDPTRFFIGVLDTTFSFLLMV